MWKTIVYSVLMGVFVTLGAQAQFETSQGTRGIIANAKEVSSLSPVFDANLDRIPDSFEARQNFPNPFNHVTTIEYDLPKEARVHAVIFDSFGRHIKTLQDELRGAGRHQLEWDGTEDSDQEVASGVYIYVISTDDSYYMGKMLFSKEGKQF
ncbi:MAG: FlgD immunoglobulin-like domain containing protein [bacterium]|nr:FlgD immunoglobulin-like domain containing protein [bacterium]MDT8302356.1 FlgD immunoglobulin-like domain containing protein [Sedimentisphaerales bacterium]